MTRLVLHIGPGKTGSTSIQNLLSLGAPVMEQAGILYPETGRLLGATERYVVPRYPNSTRLVSGSRNNHQLIAWSLEYLPEVFEKLWARLTDEIEQTAPDVVVLSGEAFSGLATHQLSLLASASRRSGLSEVSVIYYLRHAFRRAVSAYSQDIRAGAHDLRLMEYLDDPTTVPDEGAVVRQWSEAFGEASVEVKPWESHTRAGTLILDLLNTIGWGGDSVDELATENSAASNASLPASAIRAIRLVNAAERSAPRVAVVGKGATRARRELERSFRSMQKRPLLAERLSRSEIFSDAHVRNVWRQVRGWYPGTVASHVEPGDRPLYDFPTFHEGSALPATDVACSTRPTSDTSRTEVASHPTQPRVRPPSRCS